MNFLSSINLRSILISIIPALICLTIHEFSHAFVAMKLGDTTARDQGRLTLNPIRHIDPIGAIMLVVFGFGWARAVPINMQNFKNPKRGMAISALAGPVSNIILAVVAFIALGVIGGFMKAYTGAMAVVFDTVWRIGALSISLAVFNLIPIPPLDGSKVMFSVLPDNAYATLLRIERFGFIILMIIVNTKIFDVTIGAATGWIIDRLAALTSMIMTVVRVIV